MVFSLILPIYAIEKMRDKDKRNLLAYSPEEEDQKTQVEEEEEERKGDEEEGIGIRGSKKRKNNEVRGSKRVKTI